MEAKVSILIQESGKRKLSFIGPTGFPLTPANTDYIQMTGAPPGSGMIHFENGGMITNCSFSNFDTAVSSNGPLTAIGNRFSNVGTAVHIQDEGSGVIAHSAIRRARKSGIRVDEAPIYLAHCIIEDSERGMDLRPGARGAIKSSRIIGNSEDIRYAHDVLVHIFDSTAKYVLD